MNTSNRPAPSNKPTVDIAKFAGSAVGAATIGAALAGPVGAIIAGLAGVALAQFLPSSAKKGKG
jgi:hypothetical protein